MENYAVLQYVIKTGWKFAKNISTQVSQALYVNL